MGDDVIIKMAMQWLEYGKGEKTVICNLDRTICDITHRLHHVRGEKKDWKAFFADIPDDLPRTEVIDQIMAEESAGRQIVFVSARPEDHREATEAWLERTFKGYQPHLALIMRESGDKRPDTEVKHVIFDKYLKHLTIFKVYDDRPSVIRMRREKG